MKSQTYLVIVLFFFSLRVFAWGQIGHRVVGKIAQEHLSSKAKKAVCNLLGSESMAVASTYMDEIKSDNTFDYTHPWHYVTIPDGETYAESKKSDKGDVIESIEKMENILKNDNAKFDQKKQALIFLIHLVGDIHQPLHVGNGKDRGGNDYKVKWFYKPSNLHRIWDSEMINQKRYSYTELAQNINYATDKQIADWQNSTVEDWANESVEIRQHIYPDKGLENLSYEYSYKNWPIVQEQLLKAGIRLAGVLNDIYK